MTPTTATLHAALFADPAHPLAAWLAPLLDHSLPLRVFAARHELVIQQKLRHATDAATIRDLRCELAVAAGLVALGRLVYEPVVVGTPRRPDFRWTSPNSRAVFVEVTRLRPPTTSRIPVERLATVLCGKLGRLVGGANLLVVVNDDVPLGADDLAAALAQLHARAAAGDTDFFLHRGLTSAWAFERQHRHLSGMVVVNAAVGTQAHALLPAPRRPLPDVLVRTVDTWAVGAIIGPPDAADTPPAG